MLSTVRVVNVPTLVIFVCAAFVNVTSADAPVAPIYFSAASFH